MGSSCNHIVSFDIPVMIAPELAASRFIQVDKWSNCSCGFDTQFATNHLGHFQLTARLWDAIIKSGNSRVITLSSISHMLGPIDFVDLNFTKRLYNKDISYGESKTACLLFAVEFDKRGKEHGIRAFAVNPGAILTGLTRHLTDEELAAWGVRRGENGELISPEGFKTVEQGAATSIWCAVSPLLEGKGERRSLLRGL